MFAALPMYQRQGKTAFKKDLSNTIALCRHLGDPQHQLKSIHVAGTNGKGSTSHMTAAILQSAGYRVGLYTSPHLKDFRERIKINGQMISEGAVVDFIEANKEVINQIEPSFFEMTVAMAFDHFAKEEVDVAVIEVGLGGRLDSTNIIKPEVCLITNIGFDHMDMLGDSLDKIAFEKAGIIKEDVPVVISELHEETKPVFQAQAKMKKAPIIFAEEEQFSDLKTDLAGVYQRKNIKAVQALMQVLRNKGWKIEPTDVAHGLLNVVALTGLKGRWQILNKKPLMICDTGHNMEAFQLIIDQLRNIPHRQLYMVLGFVKEKDIEPILKSLPAGVQCIFTEPKIPRAMPLKLLRSITEQLGINRLFISDVNEAVAKARKIALTDDLIFIGGSTFVVAESNEL